MFLIWKSSGPTMGPIQPPTQWIQAFFPWSKAGRGVKLTTHLPLVPRSRMSKALPLYLYVPLWRDHGELLPLPLTPVKCWHNTKKHNMVSFYNVTCSLLFTLRLPLNAIQTMQLKNRSSVTHKLNQSRPFTELPALSKTDKVPHF